MAKCQNKACGKRVLVLNQLDNPKKEKDRGKLVCDECFEKMQKKEKRTNDDNKSR